MLTTEHDGGAVSHRMAAGDSCLLDSSVPHRFSASAISPYESAHADVIAVDWSPQALRANPAD